MDVSKAINALTKLDVDYVAQVERFSCTRRRKDGTTQDIEVEIYDRGEGKVLSEDRFSCCAWEPGNPGNHISGNDAADLEVAIALMGIHFPRLG